MFSQVLKERPGRRAVTVCRNVLMAGMALSLLGLSGCGGNMDDLEAYIDETKSKSGRRPDPLPEIKPYETYSYVADTEGLRSPFTPDVPTASAAGAIERGGVRPDDRRAREFLEQFPLDSLAMVGTLSIGGNDYGLLRTQDGLIHRVVPGNYVGQNDGNIVAITESEIRLVEIIPDGVGGYLEREAAIGLTD